jgi:sulfite exporter TauE/SafE
MSADWQSMVGELIPLALVVALSPFSIIPAVLLVLHSERPRATGLAFLVGWLAGLAVSTAVFLQVPRLLGGSDQEPQAWTAWLRIGIGVVLIALGLVRWLTRHRATRAPAWLSRLSSIRPATAAAIGVGLPLVNPKVLFANAAAGLVIGTVGVGAPAPWLALYTAIAGSTMAIPILAYVAARERLDGMLESLRQWIERQHAVLTAAILVVIGLVLLYQGIKAA